MEIINLQNINIETLPVSIKNEFEKIYFEFNNTEHKPIYIHSIINIILNYKNDHILLNDYDNVFTDEHFIKYSNMYNTGFNEGYLLAKEYIDYTDDIKIKTDRVFGGIYKKFNTLKETYTFLIKSEKDKYIFDEIEYYNHGIEVGKYVMCWDYVLNHYEYFIEIFDSHFLKNETEFKIIPPTDSAPEIKQKSNKSLMFEGKDLNVSERYNILKKVLDFDKKVHPLNIGELEKYQLLAYILGINKDNARKLMCGKYDSKDRDLTAYFNELGLNK